MVNAWAVVTLAVGNGRQRAIAAGNDAIKSLCFLALFFRQLFYPVLEFLFGHVRGVEICARRLALGHGRNERLEVVQI